MIDVKYWELRIFYLFFKDTGESPIQWLANLTYDWKVVGLNLIQY